MKILTLNCQHAYHKEALIGFLHKTIESKEYDAVLLQEMPEEIIPEIDTKELYTAIYDTNLNVLPGRVFILLKKEYKILEKEYSVFEKEVIRGKEYFYEIIFVVIGGKNNKDYILASLHMPAYLHVVRRIKYLAKTMKHVRRFKKRHNKKSVVVIGGDWNSIFPYEHTIISSLIDPRFKFVFPKQKTYHTHKIEPGLFLNNFFKRLSSFINFEFVLDFFLISFGVKGKIIVIESDVSDHNPVSITVED